MIFGTCLLIVFTPLDSTKAVRQCFYTYYIHSGFEIITETVIDIICWIAKKESFLFLAAN